MTQDAAPQILDVPARTAFPWSTLAGRALVAGLVLVYFSSGVAGITFLTRGRAFHELWTPLDRAIPFVPWTVYLYSWSYTFALYPLFTVRCPRLFRRVALAFIATITTHMACFFAFPVTAAHLRADLTSLPEDVWSAWGMRLTYAIDPPQNLFPSMHVSLAIASVAGVFRAERRLGFIGLPVALAIIGTITTTKQHFVADGVTALFVATAIDRAAFAGWSHDESPAPRSYGVRGSMLYLAFHGAVYLALYVAFRAGVKLW